MDITPLFKACIKTVKTRNKTFGIQSPTNDDKQRILRGKSKNAFISTARYITLQITKLRDFLLEHRERYLSFFNNVAVDVMSEAERDQIDTGAQRIMNTCSLLLKEFRNDNRRVSVSQQTREYMDAVIDLIDSYLKAVCKIHSELKALRVKRALDIHKLSRLELPNVKPTISNPLYTKNELETESNVENINDSEISKSKLDLTENDMAVMSDEGELSAEELQMFESENVQLYNELNNMTEEVKQIESKVLHIAELQEIFTEKNQHLIMPKNKISIEEKRAAQRVAQRARYARIKNNPELYKKQKEKDKKKYQDQKQKKVKRSINDLSRREQNQQRSRWRENSRAYLKRKAEKNDIVQVTISNKRTKELFIGDHANNVDPLSNEANPSTFSVNKCNCNIKIRKLRYVMKSKIKQYQETIMKIKKINNVYKKKLKRLLKEKKYYYENNHMDKDNSKSIKSTKIGKKNSKTEKTSKQKAVIEFMENDLNSFIVPGKNQFVKKNGTKKQKRHMSDTLKVLHRRYLLQNPDQSVNYPTFCKYRPFWITVPKAIRDSCLCKIHENMSLLVKALYTNKIIKEKSSEELIQSICCNVYSEECLGRQCVACKGKQVVYLQFDNSNYVIYYQWSTKKVAETKKTITIKQKSTAKPRDAINLLEEALPKYLEHLLNITVQYKTIKDLKSSLQFNEAIIHCDFSENYNLRYADEIQSFHFGGSRKHLSLHTSVIYLRHPDSVVVVPYSFCTVSESLNHTAPAVWAHLLPVLKFIQEKTLHIDTIHFVTDSPSSQYRNKYIFQIIAKLSDSFIGLKKVTWNYQESGHGKGAPDGVGGAIKTAADRMVRYGNDIGTFEDFLIALRRVNMNTRIEVVYESDILRLQNELPKKVPTFKGTMSIHQIIWEYCVPVMAVRRLSCFFCSWANSPCLHGKHLGFIDVLTNSEHDASLSLIDPCDDIVPSEELTSALICDINEDLTKQPQSYPTFTSNTSNSALPSSTISSHSINDASVPRNLYSTYQFTADSDVALCWLLPTTAYYASATNDTSQPTTDPETNINFYGASSTNPALATLAKQQNVANPTTNQTSSFNIIQTPRRQVNTTDLEHGFLKSPTLKKVPQSKRVTVLKEIKLNTDDLKSSRKRSYTNQVRDIKYYNVSSANIAEDFEELIKGSYIAGVSHKKATFMPKSLKKN